MQNRRISACLMTVLVLATLASFAFVLPASAADTSTKAVTPDTYKDWQLTGKLVNSGPIKQGDEVTYSYNLTNNGNTNTPINSPLLFSTPKEFTYSQASDIYGFTCELADTHQLNELPDTDWRYARQVVYCAPASDTNNGLQLTIGIQPNESFEFVITGIANADFPNDSKSYGILLYGIPQEYIPNWIKGENIWEMTTANSLSTITYSYSPPPQQRSATEESKPAPKDPAVLGNTIQTETGVPTEAGVSSDAGVPGYTPQDSGKVLIEDSTSNKKEVAETKTPQLTETKPVEDQSWTDLLYENRKQIAGFAVGLIALLAGLIVLVRRSQAKNIQQREYKHALSMLKNKQTNSEIYRTETHAAAFTPRGSVKRTNVNNGLSEESMQNFAPIKLPEKIANVHSEN